MTRRLMHSTKLPSPCMPILDKMWRKTTESQRFKSIMNWQMETKSTSCQWFSWDSHMQNKISLRRFNILSTLGKMDLINHPCTMPEDYLQKRECFHKLCGLCEKPYHWPMNILNMPLRK